MCPRCHGLMVRDRCWDLEETQGMYVDSHDSCMNCGHLTDPTMDKHRQQIQVCSHYRISHTSKVNSSLRPHWSGV